MGTKFFLGLLWLIHFLPRRGIALCGWVIGILFFLFSKERRSVVNTNLSLCFPAVCSNRRKRLVFRHFLSLGRAISESSVAWWSGEKAIKQLAIIEGKEILDRTLSEGPVIVLAPHFVGVEILGIRLSIEENAQSMYSQQKDPFLNKFLISRRTRFRNIRLVSRQDGIKDVIRSLKARLPLFFLPDMDFGRKDAIFVPFFGVKAATVDAVPRLAALTKAKVIPVTITQGRINDPYVIRFFEPWKQYPSNDLYADTTQMNKFIEEQVIPVPEQYYWVHKRFKTLPDKNEPPRY